MAAVSNENLLIYKSSYAGTYQQKQATDEQSSIGRSQGAMSSAQQPGCEGLIVFHFYAAMDG